jgi:hypothetical protein
MQFDRYISIICICLIIMAYLLIILMDRPGYYSYLPTNKKEHPNSYVELCHVLKHVNNRTKTDEDFFKLTDIHLELAFYKYLKKKNYTYSRQYLHNIMVQPVNEILRLKHKYNRVRPYQLYPEINMYPTVTGWTPAYPAGHAYQAYYLAQKLYNIHPELKEDLLKIAEKIDLVRVKGGIHYPSDGLFSRKLVLGY